MRHIWYRGVRCWARSARALVAASILVVAAGCLGPPPESPAHGPTPGASQSGPAEPTQVPDSTTDADFDADGFADIALGGGLVTIDGDDGVEDGVVIVVYGSGEGLTAHRTQAWSETDFAGPPVEGFGQALAVGDFDGDGFHDLAVGSEEAPVGSAGKPAGFVRIIYGSATGLTANRSQQWTQDSPGVANHAEAHDGFGSALAAANFGRGPQDDLAIGAHGEDHDAGAVIVFYGTPLGLSAAHDQLWTQASPGIADAPEETDAFGLTLVAGHFHRSGYADLAVGVYNESIDGAYGTGAVHIINGATDGLTGADSRMFTQQSTGYSGPRQNAGFSYSMAVGRFTGGPTDDLVVGAPLTKECTGTVHLIEGSAEGLQQRAQVWSQAAPGIQGSPEPEDTFGWSLAVGSFGRDDGQVFDDLAIRVPNEITNTGEAGAVTIIYGSRDGLDAAGSDTFSKEVASDSSGIDVSLRDQMTAVRVRGQLDDLFLGNLDSLHVLSATDNGLTAVGHQTWTVASLGHPEVWFGLAEVIAG